MKNHYKPVLLSVKYLGSISQMYSKSITREQGIALISGSIMSCLVIAEQGDVHDALQAGLWPSARVVASRMD